MNLFRATQSFVPSIQRLPSPLLGRVLFLGGMFGLGLAVQGSTGFAGLTPDALKVADGKKTQAYLKDGVVVGGDRAIGNCIIRDIRRASNGDYERVVIDLEGSLNGEPAAIPRPPFFQAAITPDEKRVVLSIWGAPELRFEAQKVISSFRKSQLISKVDLLPKVEPEVWTFALNLKSDAAVEVFELSSPTRIILDVRDAKARKKTPTAAAGNDQHL